MLNQQSTVGRNSSDRQHAAKQIVPPVKETPSPGLREELARTSETNPSGMQIPAPITPGPSAKNQESLQELLRGGESKKNSSPENKRGAQPIHATAHESLQELLSGTPSRVHSSAKPAKKKSATRPDDKPAVDHSLQGQLNGQQTAKTGHSPKSVKTTPRKTSRNRNWLRRIGMAIAILGMVSVGIWISSLREPATEPNILELLAASAEEYHATLGKYPEHLSDLDTFPERALEWPLHYWVARNAHGLTEIFWINEGATFRIIIRIDSEAWLYDQDGSIREIPADSAQPVPGLLQPTQSE